MATQGPLSLAPCWAAPPSQMAAGDRTRERKQGSRVADCDVDKGASPWGSLSLSTDMQGM